MNGIGQLFEKRTPKGSPEPDEKDADSAGEETQVDGERGIASINRTGSLQSRVSNLMAMGLMATLGLGLLGWYYAQTYTHQKRAKEEAQSATHSKAQGDMPLPALGLSLIHI